GRIRFAVGGGRLDGDALLALQLHRVHLGADLVLPLHLVDLVDPPGVIEDALGQGRLARVDVGRDADVADEVDVRHVCSALLIAVWNKRCRSANFGNAAPQRAALRIPKTVKQQAAAGYARSGRETPCAALTHSMPQRG